MRLLRPSTLCEILNLIKPGRSASFFCKPLSFNFQVSTHLNWLSEACSLIMFYSGCGTAGLTAGQAPAVLALTTRCCSVVGTSSTSDDTNVLAGYNSTTDDAFLPDPRYVLTNTYCARPFSRFPGIMRYWSKIVNFHTSRVFGAPVEGGFVGISLRSLV